MKKYIYLEHTADACFKAYGKTLEEAFSNSAIATFNIIVNTKKVKSKQKIEIKVKSKRLISLLYDFLDELLFRMDKDRFVLSKIENIKIKETKTGFELTSVLSGDNAKNYDVTAEIKSVTYNDMHITQEKGVYEIQVVVDL